MANCKICGHEFKTPRSKVKKQNQYHSTNIETGKNNYMCEGCYSERSESEYRMIEGVSLCARLGCARNATVLSKYCDVCENEKEI